MVKVAKKQMTDELNDVLNDMVDLDSDPSPSLYMRHTMGKNKFTNKLLSEAHILEFERML